jgi:hypothetical protein
MKFEELMNLTHDQESVDIRELKEILPLTPYEVIVQLYSQHGRNLEFQNQYGSIEISKIKWEKISLEAYKIIDCDYYEGFNRWFSVVEKRAENFEIDGWKCIDKRKDIVENWEKYQTWIYAPIFFKSKHLNVSFDLKLVEGHTRVALLKGLVNEGVVSKYRKHEIWLGDSIVKSEGLMY